MVLLSVRAVRSAIKLKEPGLQSQLFQFHDELDPPDKVRGIPTGGAVGTRHRLDDAHFLPIAQRPGALKLLGVERILSISACGSLREDYAPGHIVIPDQLYDNTKNRPRTFFGEGLVAHIGAADPFCEDLSAQVEKAVRQTSATVHTGGALITIEGPRFSTKAESNVYRSWNMSLIGMTTSPEAFLAREAEICYAAMAHVTDYDVWHETAAQVSVKMVIETLNRNTQVAQEAVVNLVSTLDPERRCNCANTLAGALITQREQIPAAALKKLEPLIGKYLGS